MDQHIMAYYIGISIILALHIYLLAFDNKMPMISEYQHYISIAGALLIVYYFLNKEKYITI